MSIVYAEITLSNALDVAIARNGAIKEQDIRQTTVNAVVDTGAWTMVINDEIRNQLNLDTIRPETGTLADGTVVAGDLVGPLHVQWKERTVYCEALVIPTAKEVLLGAIPLEAMDLIVHPRTEELVGAHGDQIIHRI